MKLKLISIEIQSTNERAIGTLLTDACDIVRDAVSEGRSVTTRRRVLNGGINVVVRHVDTETPRPAGS